jgi:hypothetical protein
MLAAEQRVCQLTVRRRLQAALRRADIQPQELTFVDLRFAIHDWLSVNPL